MNGDTYKGMLYPNLLVEVSFWQVLSMHEVVRVCCISRSRLVYFPESAG